MKLRSSLNVNASITSILLQRDNNLLATICDDLTIKIIDVETRRIVRELSGPRGQILDVVSAIELSLGLMRAERSIEYCHWTCRHSLQILDGSSQPHKTQSFERSTSRQVNWSTRSERPAPPPVSPSLQRVTFWQRVTSIAWACTCGPTVRSSLKCRCGRSSRKTWKMSRFLLFRD
jgi:hypothetical protein